MCYSLSHMKEDLALLSELVELLEEQEQKNPILKPQNPLSLESKIDFSLPEKLEDEETFKNNLKNLVLQTPRSSSRKFFNQLFGGRNSKAVLGDILSIILNTGMHTYKVNGPHILIEKEIIQALSKRAGFPDTAGGIFAPGGSMTNLKALIMARDHKDPEIKKKGVQCVMTAYASNQSHYSLMKNLRFAGIGEENLRMIKSDHLGRLDPVHLEEAISKDIDAGNIPFFINANAGTTELGSFDELNGIARIAQKYHIWMHVDGALGGSVLLSDTYRKLLSGVQHADSFSINTHKMLRTPISTSIILVKNKQNLFDSFSYNANYLYQADNQELNPGMASMQCARKNDALKLWTLWKSVGRKGLEEMVNKSFKLAALAREYCEQHPDYELYGPSESTNVCFKYKNKDPKILAQQLHEEGELMVSHGHFRGNDFIRLVTINSNLSEDDVLSVFEHIEDHV